MEFIKLGSKILTSADKSLSVIRTNPYLSGIITLFLVLYAGLAAPSLPNGIADLFESPLVKVIMMALMLIMLRGQKTGMALLLAIGFIVILSASATGLAAEESVSLVDSDISKAVWSSNGSNHKIQLRGNVYEYKDVENLLPGGHGSNMVDLMGYEHGALAAVIDESY